MYDTCTTITTLTANFSIAIDILNKMNLIDEKIVNNINNKITLGDPFLIATQQSYKN